MSTHDNAPPPPDWVAIPGNLCSGCQGSANLCYTLKRLPNPEPCCDRCSHLVTAGATIDPQVWLGDYG